MHLAQYLALEGFWAMLLAAGLAAAFTLLAGFPTRILGLRTGIMDNPGHRSSHSTPVPRIGGLAIMVGTFLALMCMFRPSLAFLVGAGVGALVTIISFIDDVRPLPSALRFGVQVTVAALAIWLIRLTPRNFGLPYAELTMSRYVALPLAVVFVVSFVNIFNFMDGINGIAAAQGIWGGAALSVLLLWGGTGNSVLTAAAVAGACLGFLPHNFPKARMFMGDVGSVTLGFVLAMLTVLGANQTDIPWVAFMLPLGVFIYDGAFTIVKRILAGENFTKPHREHHYQLLIRCGWSHARVTLLQMVLMTFCAIGAILYARGGDLMRLAVLSGLLAIMFTYSIAVHGYFRSHGDSA